MYPEEGRSAIAAAARAIADLRLGRLDEETSANVGRIQGGTARNVVPEWCGFAAEARSHDERKLADLIREMVDTVTFAASLEECEVETQVSGALTAAIASGGTTSPVQLAAAALERAGREPGYILSGGGADANVFNERGLAVRQPRERDDGHPHARTSGSRSPTCDEMVEVTLALVEAAREVDDAA